MNKLTYILSFFLILMIGCGDSPNTPDVEPGNALVEVSVNWSELSTPPAERFQTQDATESSNQKTSINSQNDTLDVTKFGVRVEYLSENAVFTQSVDYSGNDSTALITLDIPTADSVAIYAVAVNETFVVNMGVIKKTALDKAENYNFIASNFEWSAPSWGADSSFNPKGYEGREVKADKNNSGKRVTFDVVNPFDKPTKNIDNYQNFIIKINGIGGIDSYKGDDIWSYYTVAQNPNIGEADTVEVVWHPRLDGNMFNLSGDRYIVDQRAIFNVVFE